VGAHLGCFVATPVEAGCHSCGFGGFDHVLAADMVPGECCGYAEAANQGICACAICYHVHCAGYNGTNWAAEVVCLEGVVRQDVTTPPIFWLSMVRETMVTLPA